MHTALIDIYRYSLTHIDSTNIPVCQSQEVKYWTFISRNLDWLELISNFTFKRLNEQKWSVNSPKQSFFFKPRICVSMKILKQLQQQSPLTRSRTFFEDHDALEKSYFSWCPLSTQLFLLMSANSCTKWGLHCCTSLQSLTMAKEC